MAFFKYVTPDRIDVLQALKIRYTQVSALNDPFEALPAIKTTLPRKDYESNARKEIRRRTRNLPDATQSKLKEFRKQLLDKAMLQFSENEGSIAADRYQDRIRWITDFTMGFLCLSKVPDNILMWSHYADSHQGMVIEFDSTHVYFNYGTEDVEYRAARPAMTLHDKNPSSEIMKTKSLDWGYEQEVRRNEPLSPLHEPLPEGGKIILAPDDAEEDPSRVHLFDVPKDVITGVILGWKSSPEFRKRTREAAIKIGVRSTKISKAIPSRTDYKMDIVPVTNSEG
jgi:hypothetical protein